MTDEPKYFQMQITIGIEATTMMRAEELHEMLRDAVSFPLHSIDTPYAKVFETFVTQPYPYPDDP